ncbi:SlyX family protein [Celeribacter persicus]|jgi:Uncharacterized protein conserved in bacteria|uniref:SlyX protein n=1 Tax=Celeribacter persicus TaxID=1651082 RepID=A0A2T5HGV6_9RHOB|nr:SlyX family protein [Celeribacter persicus]PTQ70796.1 SlyX protein [Celeribacter persicus]
MSDETRIIALEEQVAYLTKTVEELSDVVAQQERVLEMAERRLGMLMEAEALRQSETEGSVPLADQRPPHY